MKKHGKSFLTLLSLLLLLSACGAGGVKEAGAAAPSLDAKRGFASYSAYACSTEDTAYYAVYDLERNAFFLNYMDKSTGITGPLCGKPECKHIGSGCNAYLDSWPYGLSVYDGKLYWLEREDLPTDGAYGYSVKSAELDGTGKREVRKITNEFLALAERGMHSFSASFHRGYVYLSYQPAYIVDGEQILRNYLCAFPLDTDGDEIRILDEDYHFFYNLQIYGSGIYIMTGDRVEELSMRRWDIESGQMETIFDGELPFIGSTDFWAEDNEILILGFAPSEAGSDDGNPMQGNVYRFDLANGGFEKVYTLAESSDNIIYNIASDNLFVEAIENENGTKVIAKDFEGNTVLDTFVGTETLSSGGGVIIAGADEANIYFFDVSFPNSFVAVPLDGSDAHLVWSGEK